MKKTIALICALSLTGILLFTACSTNEKPAETTTSTESVTVTSEQTSISEEATSGESDKDVNPLMPLVDAAIASSDKWPNLVEVTDETIIKDYFLLDKSNENYNEMIIMQCPMSAVMSEIIIIKATDVDAAKADLEARQKKAQDSDAWYPNDVELADSSIVGTEGDYAYFILAEGASEAETAIVDVIKTL